MGHSRRKHRQREPDLCLRKQRNVRRQNSDYSELLTVKGYGVTDNRGVTAEVALPEAVAEYCHLRPAGLFVVGLKTAAKAGTNTECVKEVPRDDVAAHLFRSLTAGKV